MELRPSTHFVQLGDYSLQSRLTAVDLPRGLRRKELTSEKKCPAAMKERKKDYWTSKSVAHARITRKSRSQGQSHKSRYAPSAVLEDTMHLVDLFLSAFAPSWIAKGSMRWISMTIAHPAAQVAGCSGALRAIMMESENARSRVLAGPRDSGRHFVSKCCHCACSVLHERGPNARFYVKSPPPPLTAEAPKKPALDVCFPHILPMKVEKPRSTLKFSVVGKNTAFYSEKCFFG